MALIPGGSRRATAGTLNLAILRQKCGISLRQISDSTKLSMRFLEAIESEEFEKLPGGIFTVSYLKQYALAIGLPEEEILEHYRRTLDPPPTTGKPETPPERNRALRVLANFQLF